MTIRSLETNYHVRIFFSGFLTPEYQVCTTRGNNILININVINYLTNEKNTKRHGTCVPVSFNIIHLCSQKEKGNESFQQVTEEPIKTNLFVGNIRTTL